MADQPKPSSVKSDVKDPLLWNPLSTLFDQQGTSAFASIGKPNRIKVLSYPTDLGSKRYPYYVMFYINAQSKSMLVQNGSKFGIGTTSGAGSRSVGQRTSSADLSAVSGVAQGITGAASKAAGTVADVATQNAENRPGTIIGFVNDAVGKTAQTGKAIADSATAAVTTNVQKRLDVAMALPMPTDVTFGSSASYQLVSGGLLGSLIKAYSNEGITGVGKAGITQLMQDAPTFAASAAASIIPGADQPGQNFEAIKNKILGIAHNDRREQAFQGMDVRSFTFSWLLIPRTQQESIAIRDMIKFFRYNMHPEVEEKNSAGLNVIIPNEVDVEFHYLDQEMQGIQKISTCVIDDVTVNVTPLGKWIAFDGTDNPVATQLTIRFKEIEPLTRLQVSMGY